MRHAHPRARSDGDTILEIRNLHKTFVVGRRGIKRSRLHALRGIDLTVARGESVAIVGESGCGKSTLLRAVAGLLEFDSGEVVFRSERPSQMIFQDAGASLTPWLAVGALIDERLQAEGLSRTERETRVKEAFEQVGLSAEIIEARPSQLSGGQQQRVAIARGTVVPPDLLLCDEPTSSLDVSLRGTVLNLLRRRQRDLGMAMIFVTHDLAVARIIADRIAVMYLGRIVESGPAELIITDPAHPYTEALLSAVPGTGRPLRIRAGEPANPSESPEGCAFHPRCPRAIDACRLADPACLTVSKAQQHVAACIRIGEADSV